MKKFILICTIMLGVLPALFADAAEDAQFRQYVELSQKSPTNPPGMTITADPTYRIVIVYVTMPIAASKSNIDAAHIAVMKQAMINTMRNMKEDLRVIKSLNISTVYTFITVDKYLFSIPISYQEF